MKLSIIFALAGIMILGISFSSCRHEPELFPPPITVCFNLDVMPIINIKCNVSGCHGSGEAPSLNNSTDLSRYVTAFKPEQSKLHKVITAHSGIEGLMPPKSHSPLSSHEIDIITVWILQGAKDDTSCVSKLK